MMARTAAGPESSAEMATAIALRVEWRLGCWVRGRMVAALQAGVMGTLAGYSQAAVKEMVKMVGCRP